MKEIEDQIIRCNYASTARQIIDTIRSGERAKIEEMLLGQKSVERLAAAIFVADPPTSVGRSLAIEGLQAVIASLDPHSDEGEKAE